MVGDIAEISPIGQIMNSIGQMKHKGGNRAKGSEDTGTTEQVTATFDTDGDGVADTEEVTTYGVNGEVLSTENRPIGSSGGGMEI